MEKVPIGKSTNMVLFPKEKVPYSTWYFFPLVLIPIHRVVQTPPKKDDIIYEKPLNFGKIIYNFFLAYEKDVSMISRFFFHRNLLIWSKYVFSKCNTFTIECNKGLFLDINLKKKLGFFKGKTTQVQKSKKMSSNFLLE